MADAELTVRISGDTGDLESSISRVESQLSQLEKSGGRGAESIAKASLNQGGFAKTVEQSKKALDEKKAALAQTEKEYKKNSKAIQDNISGLEKQRSRLGNLAVSKQEEIDALRSSSKSLEKNSTAYRENQKAIQWTETELEAVKKQHRDVGRSIDEHRTALQNEEKTLEKARGAVANAEKQYKAYANNLEEVEKIEKRLKLEEKAKGYRELGEGVDTLTKPIQAAGVAMAAGAVASAKFAVDFENNFADVYKTVDGTDEQLNKIKQDIIDMTTVGINGHSAIPQTTAELTELAAAGGQLGIQTESISSFTETLAMLGSATNLGGEEGAKTLARFMNVTATSQDKIQNLGSAVVDLGNHFATTEAEIANMAMNMGATGTAVKMSTPDILAYATALSSLGTEADAGGSAVSRIWMDIQTAVSNGGKDLEAFAKTSGKSSAEFAEAWKNNAGTAFKDFLSGLSQSDDIIASLQNLGFSNIRDLQALQKLAGPEGIQLLNDALQRSNKAWIENTALVTEFENKAGTTASQIQVMKNNLVEAGRSLGETFLPTINNGVADIKNFAQGISKMSDGQKQALITTGKWVIGLGAAGKVASGTLKGVGNTVEAIGKLKGAVAAGGALAKFAPTFSAIGGAASFAAVGIGLLAAGVWAGKKAYDAWYKSNYAWTEGLSEGNEAIKESLEKYKNLNDIQAKIKNLKLIIESPDSSQEQIDESKAKLEEIKALLSEEYNLIIKSDNSNLESSVEAIKQMSENELKESWREQTNKLAALQDKFNSYQADYAAAYQKYEKALNDGAKLSDAKLKIDDLKTSGRPVSEYADELRGIYKELGIGGADSADLDVLNTRFAAAFEKSGKEIEKYKNKVDSLNAANNEYIAISTEMANWASEGLSMAIQSGDAQEADYWFGRLAGTVERAKLNMHDYAQIAAESFNGISWSEAWERGGDALDNMVSDYIRSMQRFGASAREISVDAALLKNGFKSVGDIPKDNKQAFDDVSAQATELARSLGELDEEHSIRISADGSVQIIDDVSGKIQELESNSGIKMSVDASGDITIMNEAAGKTAYLAGLGNIHLEVNAEGNIDILNEANEKLATVNGKTGEITVNGDYEGAEEIRQALKEQGELTDKDVHQTVNGSFPGKEDIERAVELQNALKDKHVTYRVSYLTDMFGLSGKAEGKAKGTQDFEGGLAMINDEKGKADPTELVEVNGKGYIFEGKDVVLPLPKHAKVYTAEQTKQIMSRKGVPRYAKGKNNEEWENAKADWTHYIKVNEVSAIDYLEHWDAMMRKFKGDAEVVKEIQEEIAASTKSKWDEDIETMKWYLDMGDNTEEQYFAWLEAYRDENFEGNKEYWRKTTLELQKWKREQSDALNEVSEAYIEYHTAMDDWDTVGDSQLDALQRVADRQKEDVTAGKRTEKEATEYTKKLFQDSYNNRKQQSMEWLENQKKYNNMSSEDYISGLKRIEDYTEEYYKKGIIDFREYIESKNEIWRQEADEYINVVDGWHSDAELYERQASVFGWGFNGTGHKSEEEYWKAREQRELEFADDERLSENEREAARLRAAEARINYYSAADKRLTALSDEFKEAMDKAKDALDDRVQSLRDSWTVQDRKKDISDTKKQLSLYENAVTKEGQEKYSQLQEELKQLEREQKIYEIEQDNNAIIKQLEAEYAEIEKTRKIALDSTVDACNSIEAYAKGTQDKIDALVGAVNTIVEMFEGSSNEGGMGTYSFNQTINAAVNGSAEVSALISRVGRFFGKPDFLK